VSSRAEARQARPSHECAMGWSFDRGPLAYPFAFSGTTAKMAAVFEGCILFRQRLPARRLLSGRGREEPGAPERRFPAPPMISGLLASQTGWEDQSRARRVRSS
jgi:hypothetical protein